MNQKNVLSLHPVGDLELWYAQAADSSWRLPMYLRWHEDRTNQRHYAVLTPAVAFYQSQGLVMEALLNTHSIDQRTDRWVVPKAAVHSLLFKAEGVSPTWYYRWSGNHPVLPLTWRPLQIRLEAPPKKRRLAVYKSLAEFIAQERHLPTDVVNVVLTALGEVGARWMAEYRQPLNLGFCRLIAVPFRANWKQIIAFKMKGLALRAALNLRGPDRRNALSSLGFEQIVASLHNIGLTPNFDGYRLDYTLEAIPTKSFEATMSDLESKRMKAGPTTYVAWFEQTVEALYENIIEAMRSYLRKAATPFAKLSASGNAGSVGFAPGEQPPKMSRLGPRFARLPVNIVATDSPFSVFETDSDPRLIPPPPASVRKVSALLQAIEDMRQRQIAGDLEQPRPVGADGLPLLDAPKIEAGSSEVLPV